MTEKRTDYYELQIKINPDMEDIISDFCFENLPCEGVVLAEEAYKDLEMISTTEGTLKVFLTFEPDNLSEILKDERDLLDNPCLNIKIGTEILYNHFSRCGVTWQCLGTYNAGFAMENQKKRLQYAKKIYVVYTRLNGIDKRKALAK